MLHDMVSAHSVIRVSVCRGSKGMFYFLAICENKTVKHSRMTNVDVLMLRWCVVLYLSHFLFLLFSNILFTILISGRFLMIPSKESVSHLHCSLS